MRASRWRQLLEPVLSMEKLLEQLERRQERVEIILMVREPTATTAADAYEGLRRQIVAAVSERTAHLAQLAQLDDALRHGASTEQIATTVDGWLEQAGLERVGGCEPEELNLLFDLVEDLGGELEVIDVAYRDRATARVIRRGRARLLRPVPGEVAGTATKAADNARQVLQDTPDPTDGGSV